jgi:hypothetical protein
VIHGPKPPPTGKRGRPREKGDRIGKCKDAAAVAGWLDVTVRIYGKSRKCRPQPGWGLRALLDGMVHMSDMSFSGT